MADLHTITCEPVGEQAVAVLERALEQARIGNLSSVALAVVYRDGSADQAWSSPPSINTLIGSATRLVYRLNQALDA